MVSQRPAVSYVVVALLISSAPLAAQQAERRWIVDNSAARSGDGSPASPFLTLEEAARAAGEGETIVLSAGAKAYTGGIILKSGQTLVGENGTPVITGGEGDLLSVSGVSAPVTIANVSVRSNGTARGISVRKAREVVTLRDVVVSSSGGTALFVDDAAKLVVRSTSLQSSDAPALSVTGAELDAMFADVSARGDRLAGGIVLQRTTGSLAVEGGTIEGASARAISAVGATNLTFRGMKLVRSASVNGARPVDCGGDLLTGSNERCNAAVYLNKVEGALLEGISIEASGQAGVVAHDVSGLSIVDATIRNAGDEQFEHALILEELRGVCRIAGTTVEKSASRHLMLHNSAGQLALTIERSHFIQTAAPHGQQGVLVTAGGEAGIDLRVLDSVFTRSGGAALEVTGADKTTLVVRITGSKFEESPSAISLSATNAARLDYVIADNPSIVATQNAAINVYLGSPSTGVLSGTIARNVIGAGDAQTAGASCASCNGIVLSATGNGQLIADVSGNILQRIGSSAIHASATQGSARMDLTATANLIREGSAAAIAIRVQAGALAADASQVCADLGGPGAKTNTIEGAWEPNGAIHLLHRFGGTRFQLVGLTEGKSDAAAAALVSGRNGGRNGSVKVRAVLRPDSMERGFEPAERCTMPALTK